MQKQRYYLKPLVRGEEVPTTVEVIHPAGDNPKGYLEIWLDREDQLDKLRYGAVMGDKAWRGEYRNALSPMIQTLMLPDIEYDVATNLTNTTAQHDELEARREEASRPKWWLPRLLRAIGFG
jgi:hypothetical protein